MTFSFEDGFKRIDEALQEVKAVIFRIPQDSLDLIQPDLTTQLCHALECYNVTTEEEDEDPRNINILEVEGHHEVVGPQIENPDITTPLKTRQVNIGTEAEPKFVKIGDYWNDAIVDKVTELLHEYQDLFSTKITNLKGIIGDLGMMKITLKPDTKPVKQWPYLLNLKYKENVRDELDKMLVAELLNQWKNPTG